MTWKSDSSRSVDVEDWPLPYIPDVCAVTYTFATSDPALYRVISHALYERLGANKIYTSLWLFWSRFSFSADGCK